MFYALFSAKGRLNRAPYWGYSILMLVMLVVPLLGYAIFKFVKLDGLPEAELDAAVQKAMVVPIIIFTLVSIWPSFALMSKRLQDLGHAGTWAWVIVAADVAYNIAAAFNTSTEIFPTNSPLLLVSGIAWLVIGIPAFIYLGFFRGTDGPNGFGPDRLADKGLPMGAAPTQA